ncbi:MAG: hypothetical protein RMH84_03295 [Sulfolobales archaeon]|nr:hypothetical protein [Sulfolobales archaeon]MDW8010603.1 hypothetical protein [Sulfolobales archaeon]
MSEAATFLVKYLREAGFKTASRDLGDCFIVSAQRGSNVYLVGISRGSMVDVYVAKVAVPELLGSIEWSCEAIEYSPYGSYVLEKELEKLAEGVVRNFEILDRVYRSSTQRS